MKTSTKTVLTGITGASMAACIPLSAAMAAPVSSNAGAPVQDANHEATVEVPGQGFQAVHNVQGTFAFNQDEITPSDDLFNIFGATVESMCAKPTINSTISNGVANYYVNVGGDIKKAFTVNITDMEEDSVRDVLVCSCATGGTLAQAEVVGVPISGIGYCWLVARFYLMISQRRGFASCVVATILCLIFKELALSFLFTIPSAAQIVIASVMPICMCALCALAARMPVAEKPSDPKHLPQGKATKQDTLLYACVLALILSTLRGFSNLGMWGLEFPGVVGPGTSLLAAVLYAVALVVFGLFAVLVPSTWPTPARFRPATLVLLAGLFLITLRSYLGDAAVPYELLQVEELLSHLAFWSAVAALLQGEAEPTLRTTALPIAVYSGASALLVMLMSRTAALSFVFVIIVAYMVFAAVTSRELRGPGTTWQTETLSAAETGASADAGVNGQQPAIAVTDEAVPEGALNTAVSLTCDRLIEEYRLSPREAQILPMVIEGRSRAYISEQLNLSDSTVKTHISHIYGKCSVTGRQGLVELVFQAPEEA